MSKNIMMMLAFTLMMMFVEKGKVDSFFFCYLFLLRTEGRVFGSLLRRHQRERASKGGEHSALPWERLNMG